MKDTGLNAGDPITSGSSGTEMKMYRTRNRNKSHKNYSTHNRYGRLVLLVLALSLFLTTVFLVKGGSFDVLPSGVPSNGSATLVNSVAATSHCSGNNPGTATTYTCYENSSCSDSQCDYQTCVQTYQCGVSGWETASNNCSTSSCIDCPCSGGDPGGDPGASYMDIGGYVTDSTTGAGIQGVTVFITGATGVSTNVITDSTGFF